jgi:hypothetical protein
VTVGETLTQARNHAGLSVDELSERTRIREKVIRSIEQDDFAACGGDLYVRGYVRAIAGAVGIDAQPLIREFDLGRSGDPEVTRFDLPPVSEESAPTAFDLPAITDDRPAPGTAGPALVTPTVYRPQLAPSAAEAEPDFRADPVPLLDAGAPATRLDLPPVTEDLMAAGYQLGPAAHPPRPEPASPATARNRRRGLIAFTAAAAVLVVAVTLAIHFASGTASKNLADTTSPTAVASATPAGQAAPGRAADRAAPDRAAAAKASAAARARAAAKASAAAKARAAAAARERGAVVRLTVASVRAFGPDGFADGDNENIASYAIARNAPQPWSTQWYATPSFGMLKHGTGLLLDLGSARTVTGVQLDLAQNRGADLQLKAGNGTAAGDLKVVAAAHDAGGIVRLVLARPVAARYLLIWFTLLPPNGAGQYQESVYRVAVNGRR